MLGMYIPAVVLAVLGLREFRISLKARKAIIRLVLTSSMISPLLLIFILLSGLSTHSSVQYLSADQYNTFSFLKTTSKPDLVVLAIPRTSMYVPGYSGLRVVYGHPFETINAAEQEMNVNLFFEKSMTFEQENSFIAKIKYLM